MHQRDRTVTTVVWRRAFLGELVMFALAPLAIWRVSVRPSVVGLTFAVAIVIFAVIGLPRLLAGFRQSRRVGAIWVEDNHLRTVFSVSVGARTVALSQIEEVAYVPSTDDLEIVGGNAALMTVPAVYLRVHGPRPSGEDKACVLAAMCGVPAVRRGESGREMLTC